ncbi:MAG TPA: ATP-binding protein [Bacteroidia bacterium]|nr:ATP-binding protein [Bacteroidia bacterium]HRS59175.1 ATP-binding protein [Bacteroidia bacterium]
MKMIQREILQKIELLKNGFPAIAILGPRQCGKTTLAKYLADQIPSSIYLDLETDIDRLKLSKPELFFEANKNSIFFIDEIQMLPDLFRHLRSVIDKNAVNGQFFLLGSASRDLVVKSSESLAGRVAFIEMNAFTMKEVQSVSNDVIKYWYRGGFPRSYLADNDFLSLEWRINFIKTFLERDIPQLGFQIPSTLALRLWKMSAHYHGQVVNFSSIANSLGISHNTVRKYLEILSETFMLRLLPPFVANVSKRLVKSPKLYIRDSGILHALLVVDNFNELMGHPLFGSSWEGMVIENILNHSDHWNTGFYRTSNGAEIDLILQKGNTTIAVECKANSAPVITRGFYESVELLNIQKAFIVAPVESSFPLSEKIWVCNLPEVLDKIFS